MYEYNGKQQGGTNQILFVGKQQINHMVSSIHFIQWRSDYKRYQVVTDLFVFKIATLFPKSDFTNLGGQHAMMLSFK